MPVHGCPSCPQAAHLWRWCHPHLPCCNCPLWRSAPLLPRPGLLWHLRRTCWRCEGEAAGSHWQLQQHALTWKRLHFLVQEDVGWVELRERPQACGLVSIVPPLQLLDVGVDVEDVLCCDVVVTRIAAPIILPRAGSRINTCLPQWGTCNAHIVHHQLTCMARAAHAMLGSLWATMYSSWSCSRTRLTMLSGGM